MKQVYFAFLLGALVCVIGASVAFAEDYTVTITVDGEPVTLTISTGQDELVIDSETVGVVVNSIEPLAVPTSPSTSPSITSSTASVNSPTLIPTASPTLPITNTSPIDKVAMLKYGNAVAIWAESFGSALTEIEILLISADKTPSLLRMDTWKAQMVLRLAVAKGIGNDLRSIYVPPSLLSTHEALVEVVNHLEHTIDLLAQGLGEVNVQQLEKGMNEMKAGNAALNRAALLIEQMQNQR